MKRINILALSLISMLALTSCSSDDETTQHGMGQELQITVSVNSDTRTNPDATDATAQQFNDYDQIFISDRDGSKTNNLEYTYNNGKWTTNDVILWESGVKEIEAYYPSTISRSAPTLESNQGSKNLISYCDVMTAKGTFRLADGPVVNLNMNRETARIRLTANLNSEFNGSNAKLQNVEVIANANLTFWQNPKREELITVFNPYNEGNVYTALVAPTAAKPQDTFVKITVATNQGIKTFEVKGIPEIQAQKSYNYILNIGKENVEVASVTINGWTDAPVSDIETDEGLVNINKASHTISIIKPGALTQQHIDQALNGGRTLNIYGFVNSSDFKVIREAAGCNYTVGGTPSASKIDVLNLRNSQFVSGGESYCMDNTTNTEYFLIDNTVPSYAFQGATLNELVLTGKIDAINDYAFKESNIKTVCMKRGLVVLGKYIFQSSAIENIKSDYFSSFEWKTLTEGIFMDCHNLKTFNTKKVETINDLAFAQTSVDNFIIDDNTTSVGKSILKNTASKTGSFIGKINKVTVQVSYYDCTIDKDAFTDMAPNNGQPVLDLTGNDPNARAVDLVLFESWFDVTGPEAPILGEDGYTTWMGVKWHSVKKIWN